MGIRSVTIITFPPLFAHKIRQLFNHIYINWLFYPPKGSITRSFNLISFRSIKPLHYLLFNFLITMLFHGPQSGTDLSLRLMRPLQRTESHWLDPPHWIPARTYPYAAHSVLVRARPWRVNHKRPQPEWAAAFLIQDLLTIPALHIHLFFTG